MAIRSIIYLISAFSLFACSTNPTFTPTITDCDCSEWENWTNRDSVSCHYLTVPEDHSNPDGKTIQVAFAVFKATSDEASDIPILFLTGGPGGRSLGNINWWADDELREWADVIVVEQRGIGLSSPLPILGEKRLRVLADDLTAEEEKARTKAMLDENLETMKAAGIDHTKYNSTQNARDFGALMDLLDYEQFHLYGSSYGTRLGAGIMRDFPDKVHAAILNGPANLDGKALEGRFPNLMLALNKTYAACAADSACNAQYPNLKETFVESLHGLAEEPITVKLDTLDYTINPQDAIFLARYLLYRSTGFQTVPPFIHALRDRDIEKVQELAQGPMLFSRGSGIAIFYAFQAYEEWTEETPGNVAAASAAEPELQYGLGWFSAFIPHLGEWGKARASVEEQTFKDISVPALVIVNEYDPVTPPHHTSMFEDAITNCQVIRLNQFGHGSGSGCLDSISMAFYANPLEEIDRSCLE